MNNGIENAHFESWCGEYGSQKSFTTMHEQKPPGSLLWMLERYEPAPGARVVDLGSGAGRAALYLAAHYQSDVYARDFVPGAIDELRRRAAKGGMSVHSEVARIDLPWPDPSEFYDLAIDSTASMSIATALGRMTCRDEMFRTLKPGGMALVSALSVDDELERSLPPGPEPDTVLWPSQTPDGEPKRIEKLYTLASLKDFFAMFELVAEGESRHVSTVWDRQWDRHTVRVLLRKP